MKRISALMLFLILLFSGCGWETQSGLFALPELPEKQKMLMGVVSEVREGGYEYAEPLSGINRQSLQLVDVDGDAVEEGIAFLKDVFEEHHTYIYIFRNIGDRYEMVGSVAGPEKDIYSVSYSNILDNTGYEMIVEWGSAGDSEHPITVYNLDGNNIKEMLTLSAIRYSVSDIDNDGKKDLIAIGNGNGGKKVEIYSGSDELTFEKRGSAELSKGSESIIKIMSGKLASDINGVFIECEKDGGIVTDVVAHKDGKYVNIIPEGVFCKTKAFCADLNGDGTIEIPTSLGLKEKDLLGDKTYLWNIVDENGLLIPASFTYHDYDAGWYVSLPIAWARNIVVKRSNVDVGQVEIKFLTYEQINDSDEYLEAALFSIYMIKGENRGEYESQLSDFRIAEKDKTVYAAKIYSPNYLATAIDKEFIIKAFNILESDWVSDGLFS